MSNIYDEYREPPRGCGETIAGTLALIILGVLLLFSSCKTPAPIVQTVEKERIVEIHTRDTSIVTQADSASVRALLKCDSAYNVILFDLVTMQGERIDASANAQKQGKDMLLSLDCKEDSLVNEIQMRDSIISNFKKETVVVPVDKPVSDYYKRTSAGFWILLLILLVIVGFKAYKIYLKIQSGGLL